MKIKIRHLLAFVPGLAICLGVAAQQPPTLDSLLAPGSYQVSYYSRIPPVPEFSAGTLYFPANKGLSFGAVVISPGYGESQESISWWARLLASHGFAVLTIDTNDPQESPEARANALLAALEVLRGETVRMGSMLRGKIDTERMALMGHGMGGGGSLLAAAGHGDEVKAIPLMPWQPESDFDGVTVPTLIMAAESDTVAAPSEHAWHHYQSLSGDSPRMYLEIKGGNHYIANTEADGASAQPNLDARDLLGRMAVAWLKFFVDGDEAYRDLVFGQMPAADRARLSKWEFVE
jgi:dienelactone hydrolase